MPRRKRRTRQSSLASYSMTRVLSYMGLFACSIAYLLAFRWGELDIDPPSVDFTEHDHTVDGPPLFLSSLVHSSTFFSNGPALNVLSKDSVSSIVALPDEKLNHKVLMGFRRKVISLIAEIAAESDHSKTVFAFLFNLPEFRISIHNKLYNLEGSERPAGFLGSHLEDEVRFKLDLRYSSTPEIKEMIRHELWHAANYHINKVLGLCPGAGRLQPWPFNAPAEYRQFKQIFFKDVEAILQYAALADKKSKGLVMTRKDKVVLEKFEASLSSFPYREYAMFLPDLSKLTPLFGREPKVGDRYDRAGAQEEIRRMTKVKNGYMFVFKVLDRLQSFKQMVEKISQTLDVLYGSAGDIIQLVELDCYYHTVFPDSFRKEFMLNIERYHQSRWEEVVTLLAEPEVAEEVSQFQILGR